MLGRGPQHAWHCQLLHTPWVGITFAVLPITLVAFPLATPHGKGHARGPAGSMELPPRHSLPGHTTHSLTPFLSLTHTHTHGSGRTTYSPFLFGRRTRLRESFILLFNLREQTEEVTGRSEVRVGRHRRKTSKLLLREAELLSA